MTSTRVLTYLREIGAGWTGRGVAVECGCWLGATCAALAEGLTRAGYDRPIYCFDHWLAICSEVAKAARQGCTLHVGQNLEPVFRQNVAPFYSDLVTRRGPIQRAQWNGTPIGIFLLDAAKSDPFFMQTLRIFGPAWIPGEAVIGLMDFYYYRKFTGEMRNLLHCQERFVQRHTDCLTPLRQFPKLSPAFFAYTGTIP